MGIEDPDVDVAEQQRSATENDEGAEPEDQDGFTAEADPADVAEQHAIVPEDDDEDGRPE